MIDQIVHVVADDDDMGAQDAAWSLARTQTENGAVVTMVLPTQDVVARAQSPSIALVIAPDDQKIAALINSAQIVHVHGAGAMFHRVARLANTGCRLVADVRADSAEWRAASSEKRVERALRQSLCAYGFIAVASWSGNRNYVPRDWGVSFYETQQAACRAAEEAYATVIGSLSRSILGLKIEIADETAAVQQLDRCIAEKQPIRVGFVNANLALQSVPYLRAMKDFVLFNDGIGINLASKLLYGSAFPRNLNGTDFVPHYLTVSRSKLRIFLLGSKPAVLARVQDVFAQRWPWHEVVGLQDGYYAPDQAEEIAEKISAARTDLVLVAMGNPRQELWAAQYIPRVAPAAMCVGALFDFLAGEVVRAPTWVRAMNLEWGFRLLQEPRRLARRYLVEGFLFFLQVHAQFRSGARAGTDFHGAHASVWQLLGSVVGSLLIPQKARNSLYSPLRPAIQNGPAQRTFAMQLNREKASENIVGDYFETFARFIAPDFPVPDTAKEADAEGVTRWSLGQTMAFGTVSSLLLWAGLFSLFHFVA